MGFQDEGEEINNFSNWGGNYQLENNLKTTPATATKSEKQQQQLKQKPNYKQKSGVEQHHHYTPAICRILRKEQKRKETLNSNSETKQNNRKRNKEN